MKNQLNMRHNTHDNYLFEYFPLTQYYHFGQVLCQAEMNYAEGARLREVPGHGTAGEDRVYRGMSVI